MHHDLLDGSQILEFYETGFLRPGSVFGAGEVEELRALLDRACTREKSEGRLYDLLDDALWPPSDPADPESRHGIESGGEPTRHVPFLFNLWRDEPEIRQFIFDTTLGRWAAQLIGARRVRVLRQRPLEGALHRRRAEVASGLPVLAARSTQCGHCVDSARRC